MRTAVLLCTILLLSSLPVKAFDLPDISMPDFSLNISGGQDARQKEAKYIHNIKKQEEKEKMEREKLNVKPSGYMTVRDYEALSAPKDKLQQEIPIPKVERPSDMKYVPQPIYKIVRYNNPPGSPEISLSREFYKNRQQNSQGIASPDYTMLVYPAIYYYPDSGSTACDLFMVPLDENETNLNKILKANVMHKKPDAILSTDKDNQNYATFRTITPIDFSADSSMLLAKGKIGNTADGIWKTNVMVYHFKTGTSYELVEVRDAIIYYWKENKGLDLDDKRWDIFPLGFDMNEPNRVIVSAYAYPKDKTPPIFLGLWSVDSKGEQSRLISFNQKDVQVAMNGYKIVQDGVVAPLIVATEEKNMKKVERSQAKEKKQALKNKEKEIEAAYKLKIKEMDAEFKETQKDFSIQQRINGSTSLNDSVEKYEEIRAKMDAKEAKAIEQKQAREAKLLEKKKKLEEKLLQKKQNL